ncbi:hypothetical protein NL108_013850 [Boleophthalmus pectinirostris]|uniref:zinc finger and SCAN domain-containing protein 21-like n=1 Tax=Boleophthalmus pectinirostris TaxID=150288 RepID=UPI000A1C50E4|nr:zinc finger and SCAN domain-containing protein 21-like [Boleophthalmus pectinirostris]KAJ0051110.1 hypothetical protein NL108_013850 [Boleophthalmus pectinirostris]
MSKAQALRDLVMERLVLAADEIFALFERTFAEYEEEVLRSKHLQPRMELHKEDAPTLILHPEVQHSPDEQMEEDQQTVQVKQEEDHSFEFSAAYSVKSEANIGILIPEPADDETECPTEEQCAVEEEPGCSLNLPPDNNEQNYETDDSEDWHPADKAKKPPKSPGLKKDTKRGRPARNANVLLDKNTASERNCDSVANGGKKKGKQPKCSVCGKTFQTEGHFKKHWLAHCGQRPFKCQVCDKAFRNKANYRKHMIIHEDDKPFICPACNRGFSQKCHLQAHMRIHTGEKPFSCPDCGVRFRYQRNIYRHITAVHKGEKPFSCPFCDKAFSQKSPFIVHMRTHTGEKPFSCSVCKKGFIDNCHLKKHAKTHEVQNR